MALCVVHEGDPDVAHWGMAAAAVVLLGLLVVWGSRCQRSRFLVSSTKEETLVAMRSAFVFVVMALPFAVPQVEAMLPGHFKASYHWLPFWYVYVVKRHWGECLEMLRNSMLGFAFAISAMFVLQFFMPGGAGPWASDPRYQERALMPGGFSLIAAIVYGVCFAYLMFLSDQPFLAKKYGIAVFSELFIGFLNPAQEKSAFRAVLWLYDYVPAWDGSAFCLLCVLVLANILGALTVPLSPKIGTCRYHAIQKCQDLGGSCVDCLEHLVKHFREGTSAYALNGLTFFVRQIGVGLTELDALLESARWEVRDEKLQDMVRLAEMLRGCHQVILSLLTDVKQLVHASDAEPIAEISIHLECFLASFRDAVTATVDPHILRDGAHGVLLRQVAAWGKDADCHVTFALRELQASEEPVSPLEIAFVESLRTCPALLAFYSKKPKLVAQARSWRRFIPTVKPPSRLRHLEAIRVSLPWVLALAWSVFKRDYSPTVAITVAWTWQSSLGAMFEYNMNRMLGSAMGLVLGTIPAGMLPSDAQFVPAVIIYTVAMFVLWATAIYGMIAKDAKWGEAFKLFAGHGGVQMLRLFPTCALSSNLGEAMVTTSFTNMVDVFIACLLIIVVDLGFAITMGRLTVHHVAKAIPDCLERTGDLVQSLLENETANRDLGALQHSIAVARQLECDAKSEDFIWSNLFAPAYSTDFVTAIVDACEVALISAFALQESAARYGHAVELLQLLRQWIPACLADLPRQYAAIAKAMLLMEDACAVQDDPSGESEHALHQSITRHRLCASAGFAAATASRDPSALVALRVRTMALCMAVRQLGSLFKEEQSLLNITDEGRRQSVNWGSSASGVGGSYQSEESSIVPSTAFPNWRQGSVETYSSCLSPASMLSTERTDTKDRGAERADTKDRGRRVLVGCFSEVPGAPDDQLIDVIINSQHTDGALRQRRSSALSSVEGLHSISATEWAMAPVGMLTTRMTSKDARGTSPAGSRSASKTRTFSPAPKSPAYVPDLEERTSSFSDRSLALSAPWAVAPQPVDPAMAAGARTAGLALRVRAGPEGDAGGCCDLVDSAPVQV